MTGNEAATGGTPAKVDAEKVLRTFMKDGQFVALPAKPSRRRVLLEYVAAAFEPGVRYSELEVNAVLRAFYQHDYVALRRYLIDAGLLSRENAVYWRSVDIDPPDVPATTNVAGTRSDGLHLELDC